MLIKIFDTANLLTVDKLIIAKLPDMEIAVSPPNRNKGVKIYFNSMEHKSNFLKDFKNSYFGSYSIINEFDFNGITPQEIKTVSIFTCVIKNIPINLKVDDLKKYMLKEKLPITDSI